MVSISKFSLKIRSEKHLRKWIRGKPRFPLTEDKLTESTKRKALSKVNT